jgi:hypothetical protein
MPLKPYCRAKYQPVLQVPEAGLTGLDSVRFGWFPADSGNETDGHCHFGMRSGSLWTFSPFRIPTVPGPDLKLGVEKQFPLRCNDVPYL